MSNAEERIVTTVVPGEAEGVRLDLYLTDRFTYRSRTAWQKCIKSVAILLGLRGLHSLFTGGSWGFISILIAWMIWREGWREYRQALAEERFGGWSQDDFNARVSPPPYDR